MRIRAIVLSAAAVLGTLCISASIYANGPATEPSADVSTQPSVVVSPEAQAVLDQMKSAYAALKSLDLSATIDANFDVDGKKEKHHSDLDSSWQSDGMFRSEIKDDAVVGNTGEKQFIFLPARNAYLMFEAPKDKTNLDTLSDQVAGLVRDQNLSLSLALATDAGAELISGANTVSRSPNVEIDGNSFSALTLSQDGVDMVVLVDPRTHLVRRANMDFTKTAKLRGAQDVKAATVVVDYKNTPDAPTTDQQYAWAPPAGAQEIHPQPADESALKGKAAPAFTLTDLAGKNVSSTDLKGSVYILDFWATWCGPCVASLPDLDKIYQDNKTAGLKVFAVNQGEDKDTVQKFADAHKLSLTVLLDGDQKVGSAYGANAIPETAIIGKDGKVIEVFVGSGHDDDIRKVVRDALKGN